MTGEKALVIVVDTLDSFLRLFIRIVCILLLLIGSYGLYDSYMMYYNAQDKGILKFKPQLNTTVGIIGAIDIPDAVAWLTLDDTTIDIPIMQGADNTEYLNKSPLGEFALSGSIFLDYRNTSDFTDYYSIVYGHHMEHGAMFGALDYFKEESFFNEHMTGTLIINGKEHHVQVFAVMDCMATDQNVFYPFDKENVLSYIQSNASHYREPEKAEHIIALTTCAAVPSDARLAVYIALLD